MHLVGKGDMAAAEGHLEKVHERIKLKKQAEVRYGFMGYVPGLYTDWGIGGSLENYSSSCK